MISKRPLWHAALSSAASLPLLLSACAGHGTPFVTPADSPAASSVNRGHVRTHGSQSGPIQHVVVIIQENRSLDNLFQAYPGANTQSFGFNSKGQQLALTQTSIATGWDILHRFTQATAAIDYKKGEAMDGFDLETCIGGKKCPTAYDPAYTFVQQSDTLKYWQMAQSYVLADNFYASDLDSSFEGHQYLIAGQAETTWGIPTKGGLWGCDGGPTDTVDLLNTSTKPATTTTKKMQVCFDPPVTQSLDETIGDELDAAALPWRYYAPAIHTNPGYIWSAYDAINHIRNGADWTNGDIVNPPKKFITDVAAGKLAAVTYITPELANSDHPGNGSKTGPAWVASLVDAVGKSKFWNSTVIFITWDDWGGFYDHAPPPLLDYDGLGIRVPLVAISPYALAPQGSTYQVAHTQYEFGSILKFIETTFGLPALAASDSRANNFGSDVFNFNQAPRAFKPFASKQDAQFFLRQAPSGLPPDTD
jgi:phospholipase C